MRPNLSRGSSGIEGYADQADALAAQYESIAFADVHRDILHLLPLRPSRVLDVGAGTGRDAAALASMGHHVTAVEPTKELRDHGKRLHAGAAIQWIDDLLPNLDRVLGDDEHFDLILLTMHLDSGQRQAAMRRLNNLLARSGLIIMSLRHGPIPDGRRMFDISPDETCRLFEESGLRVSHRREREDVLGRADIRWTFLAFRKELA
jgi:SAM-dependent methyltransferase